MRLIALLLVLALIGWLAARQLSTQTASVSDAARQAGVSVPPGATPREQVEAVGAAVEKLQAEQMRAREQQADAAARGEP